mgnify:CR=1 FL=1
MQTVVFCHGIPGSVQDAALLQRANPHVDIVALDLLSLGPDEASLVAAIKQLGKDQPVHLVGFSIGAMVAIKAAAASPELISRLTLVSPAAPLSTGPYLPDMAGKAIFALAMKRPKVLRALTWVQGRVAHWAPGILIKALFAKCGTAEKQLLEEPVFKAAMVQALRNSFAKAPKAYLSYVASYVDDWSATLPMVTCPVDLWHGTKDTWSPPDMSHRLVEVWGTKATLHQVQDAEHYSTLQHAMLELAP